jgi:hypothetical protein
MKKTDVRRPQEISQRLRDRRILRIGDGMAVRLEPGLLEWLRALEPDDVDRT